MSNDRAASDAAARMVPMIAPEEQAAGVERLSTRISPAGATSTLDAPARAPASPPRPRDPIAERAEEIWKRFASKSESADGRIAIFMETLDDVEVMDDEPAYEMLNQLHADALSRGERSRFYELVAALRERLPEVYAAIAYYYLSLCIIDALAENRLEALPPLTLELATTAGDKIEIFSRTAEALAYHGQLPVLLSAYRIAAPDVRSSANIMPWAIDEFINTGLFYESFDSLERNQTPDPADPVFLDRIKVYGERVRECGVSELINDLTGHAQREWLADDFVLQTSKRRTRDEWDDDDDDDDTRDPAVGNISSLTSEFVGYARREEGIPFTRAQLAAHQLYDYLVDRQRGRCDPQPSMLERAMRPNQKMPKPPRPAHPLCPERITLDVFLAQLINGLFSCRYHTAAAAFQAIPAWLRFLESRRMIEADLRRKVIDQLRPLHETLLRYWVSYPDDPTLARQQAQWPDDAAKGPDEFAR